MSVASPNNAGEYLNELEANKAFEVLNNCFTVGSDLTIRNEFEPNPLSAKISFFADSKIFLETEHAEKMATFKGQTSIKFFIGSEVYFIKTTLEVVEKQICFDQSAKVVQLLRRKEPRYNIPEKWNQTAAIWSIELRIKNQAKVINFSLSGCRFEVPRLSLDLSLGDQIRLQYQIFKRANVVCDAIVRFITHKPNGSAVLGLEFTNLQKGHKSRIESIVGDLINHGRVNNLL